MRRPAIRSRGASALPARLGLGAPDTKRLIWLAATVLVAVVLLVAPSGLGSYQMLVAYEMLQLAALAQAWNLLGGYGGLASLAVGAFVGIGLYASAKLSVAAGLPLLPSTLAAGAAATIFALLVSVPMFRFRGLYFAIATLVLSEALLLFMENWNGLGGEAGINLTAFAPSLTELYYYGLAIVTATTALAWLLLRHRLGFGLRALRDNEDVAQEMGVSTFRAKLVAFIVTAFAMGAIGGVQAFYLGRVEPSGSFSIDWTINTVNAVIIGGIGTLVGPLLGAAFTVELGEQLASYPQIHLVILGALLIVIIRFAPNGLWGLVRGGTQWLWARATERRSAAAADQMLATGAAAHPTRAGTPAERPLAALERPPTALGGAHRVTRQPGSGVFGATSSSSPGAPLLQVRSLSRAFGGVQAVTDVSVEARSGEAVGIIGPNGAGKSTLIALLSGTLRADSGEILFAGTPMIDQPPHARTRMGIGRTHQIPQPFMQLTVLENLLVAELHGAGHQTASARREAQRILERTGLDEFAGKLAGDLGLLRLKRLELARALALRPRVLLLDEIAAGLVESEVRELIELIGELRSEVEAIVIVEHMIDVIRACCDRVVVLDRGRVLTEGEPDRVLADERVSAVYLGTGAADARGSRAQPRPATQRGARPLLSLRAVEAAYGHFRALHGVTLEIAEGEAVGLLGANGAGKTTTARVISGQLAPSAGTIEFGGEPVGGLPAHRIARLGIAHCMEGRRIFGDLSVSENLELAGRMASPAQRRQRIDEVFSLFDVLAEKRRDSGAALSGGQQQMLAIGRALMADPRLIIFDEISLGLAPVMVDRIYAALGEVRARGVSILVIEQNVERGLALAERVYVLEKGRIALAGAPEQVRHDPHLRSLYVGEAEAVT
jgi:branched-chain amino acid transport system ATP-binding protein